MGCSGPGIHSRASIPEGKTNGIPKGAMTRTRVLIFGSFAPPGIPCGITAAVNTFVASPITESYDLELVSTYRSADTSRGLLQRLTFGVKLMVTTAWRAIFQHADIIEVHTASSRDFLKHAAVIFAAKLTGRPVMLRIHGGNFANVYESASPGSQRLIRWLLRLPSRVVVLSNGWAKIISRIQPQAKATVIPNSVDCHVLGEIALHRHPAASDILLLGNLCADKGHFDMIEAAAIVARSFPDCVFLFAGAERDKGALQQLQSSARELDIEANVTFLGPIFGDDKMNALTRAGIFAMPSHLENMPISLMEAMAAGLPVVASNVGAISEMVEDKRTGLLIEARDTGGLADALLTLLNDHQRRYEMGKAGQRTATKCWDTAVAATATEAVYRSLLS